MPDTHQLEKWSGRIASLLIESDLRIVFAESCTAGLLASVLGAVPGISACLCGSLVTYREATKTQWLGVTKDQLSRFTAVSEVVARQMVQGALSATPEADLAVSITGHLGPDAPADQDGIVFVGIGRRGLAAAADPLPSVVRLQLASRDRASGRSEAARAVFQRLCEALRAERN